MVNTFFNKVFGEMEKKKEIGFHSGQAGPLLSMPASGLEQDLF